MRAAAVVALAALALCASPAAASFLEAPATIGWRRVADAEASHPLSVKVALARTNEDKMTQLALDVANPNSPRYTEYPTMAEALAITAPTQASIDAVTSWLTNAGISHELNAARTTIDITTTVEQASALFNTRFHAVANDITSQVAVIGEEANVPAELEAHIDAVFGVTSLPLPPRKAVRATAPNVASVTPSVITTQYNISGVTPAGTTANRQAIAEFQGQLLSQADLTTFFSQYVKGAAAGDDKVFKYVGDQSQGEGVEANLDVQYIMGVAPGIKTEAWQYAGQDFCQDLKQWTQQIISTTNPPNVFSVSYGWQGSMSQIGCSTAQIASIDADYKTITATGISIIFASGDSGSGYSSFFGTNPMLYASWPASSQWVTAVGATRFINQMPADGEQASDQFGSGGGFSRIVNPAPAFQTSAIAGFYKLETNAPKNQSEYGYGGRGTPDVAALGEGFEVIMNGSPQPVGGTSAACPTFAAVVSLLNEARIQAGKKPMGCLNQWLYGLSADNFNDITVGNDRISRSGTSVPDGFDCVKGWDPVTGFGTPVFTNLLKSAMAK